MEDKYVYDISGRYDESYSTNYGQVILLFGCFVLLLLSIVLTVIDLANIWFLGVCLFFNALLIFINSKVYDIEYDANWFYLKRLFYKTEKISVDDFLEVKKTYVPVADVYVVFKDKKVLTLGKYVFNPFNLFMTNKEYSEMHTVEIKKNIERAKNNLPPQSRRWSFLPPNWRKFLNL
jgi:hypothetical protein